MRTTFIVGSKLLGIFFTVRGLRYLITAFMFADGQLGPAIMYALSAALIFAVAFILMFRTDRLGQLLGIDSEPTLPANRLDPAVILHIGIVLIGVYVFVTHVGMALSMVASYLMGVQIGGIGGAPVRILIEGIPVALSLYLVFRADRVIDLINWQKAEVA